MELPPGIVYIIANAPRIALPPALVFCGIQLWNTFSDVHMPIWLQVPLYIASLPLILVCGAVYGDFRDRRQAVMKGAILAPQVPSKWPGGLDLLLVSVRNFRGGYMGEVIEQQCKDNGNAVSLNILWENRIFTMEPEHVKAILATQFNSFAKGPIFYDTALSLLGTGVFNSDGDIWKFHRSMTRPFFNRDRISDFETFEKHADDAIGQLKARLRQGYPVDFQDMISRFTLDSATEFLFGKDVCSLSAGLVYPPNSPLATNVAFQNHPANQFAHAFLGAQLATAYRGRFGKSWRLFELWNDRVKKDMRVCHKFIDPILEEALSRKKALKDAGLIPEKNEKERVVLEGETLLDHLANYTEDISVIRDEILNIMIAGRDTTAGTLTCAIWMLSQHPSVLHKLREEILTAVGTSRSPTLEDLREMKYLKAVINETLRLYPPVPFNGRTSVAPTVLPAAKGGQPIYVPANTNVRYSVFHMQRRKDLWGPDADEFDPDRFLDGRLHKYLTPNPFIFVPFNAGPRICLGQQFAYNEVSYFLVRLLQVFSSISFAEDVQTLAPADWAKAPGRKGVEKAIVRGHLTMYIHDGLWVRMEEASSNA
ncbi:cytochrome P450 [Boletus edulis BED1]|uniref:Cytochrome P450 n=1 Tax=Boletus edulis BED1 TaxID=1328754 RepID=A0AAD4C7E2_BOLED|nr:cytochrome P450 [Boletus edulis BED1]